MKKINVMHLIQSLNSGGAERVVLNYLKFHDSNRFKALVCILDDINENTKNELIANNLEYYILNKGSGFNPNIILKIAKILMSKNINVLHMHNFSAIAYGTLASILTKRMVLISTEHNVFNKKSSRISILKIYLKGFLNIFLNKIITVSDQVQVSQRKYNIFARNKFVTIYNGIDLFPFENAKIDEKLKTELGIQKNDFVISKVASLTPQKGHQVLIEAATDIINMNNEVKFLIVGDGNLNLKLKKIIQKKNLQNYFIFTGVRNDIPKLLKISNLFVLSSFWEGFPITILEAMASSLPIVATDVGGNKEVITNNKNGWLVESGNPTELSTKIFEVMNNYDRSKKIANNGYREIKNKFTAKRMVERTEKLYYELKTF